MAIWCPALAIDRWRLGEGLRRGEGADAEPFALITETAHGPRIAAANPAGRDAGVHPGMMLADARALCPALAVAVADPAGDLALLERLALWAQRWGPWSALDPPDGLIVDVTGAAHLFGGEAAMLDDVRCRLVARGFAARTAIAPTAGAAWALAHYGGGREIALEHLPVAALRLDGATELVLRRLGLKRIGDLSGVARDALARRFRSTRAPAANPLVRLDQLLGRVPEPILPVLAEPLPLVQRRLMEPIRHRSLLDQVLADLCVDMARLLEGQAKGGRRFDLALWKVDGEVLSRRLELAAASRDAAHIAGLFTRKLDDIDAGFGIELARLSVPWSEPLPLAQRDFEAAAEAHGTSLAAFVDRLAARLGPQAVRRPQPRASHLPERAQRWVGALEAERNTQGELALHARPLKLLDRAEPIAVLYASPDGLPRRFRWRGEVHEVARAEGPERIAPEWWRERSTTRLRDYYRVEDDAGRRYWIYRAGLAGDGRGGVPEWFLQGLYA
ncbi:DUF6504 family protein [Novosphingobium sp.]|uniref:DUF6504 family protein n=1 Tax=Novosphingobium sp. TaxID=1874826 RepID=UPI0035B30CB8